MNYNYYQVEPFTAAGDFTISISSTTTNAEDWYYVPYVPTPAADKQYPTWLQPYATSETATSNMKYCGQCYV